MTNAIAVISDIHANLPALQAVLADIEAQGVTEIYCLGDVVGYGGNPAECVEIIRARSIPCLKGNHDEAVALSQDSADWSDPLRMMFQWTREKLTAADRSWLGGLPMSMRGSDFEAVHASLHHPEQWAYMLMADGASLHFKHQTQALSFVGHTHQPKMWVEGEERPANVTSLEDLRPDKKQVVNVGSVGQPRDKDPRACYVIYRRTNRDVWWRRVPYDIEAAQRAIMDAGLPASYAARLEVGK